MDAASPEFPRIVVEDAAKDRRIGRRRLLGAGAHGLAALSTLGMLDVLGWTPERVAQVAPKSLPDIQFDIADFIAPARTTDGVLVRFGPVYTLLATFRLRHTPTRRDQQALSSALEAIEAHYPFSPSGVFTFVAYGIPYFNRLPGGMGGARVASHMPRLLADSARYALEEAMPSPTDVSPQNPGIKKQRFNVPVAIETNDVLVTLRSDRVDNLLDVARWIDGSHQLRGKRVASPQLGGLLAPTSLRVMFQQIGLPRQVAERHRLPYAQRIHPRSPMWMGFTDQQVSGSGPASITTFGGNASARLTTAAPGDYFANGAIQHLSHVILDLDQFYAQPDEPFSERAQYMFRSDPQPAPGNADQFADGGGPAFLENVFQGADDAQRNAEGMGTAGGEHRVGHLAALQRSSRAADGTPIHIRMDGPGFDAMDVPGGAQQPKLQFTAFVPTADFFATMRRNQASLDLVKAHGVDEEDNGLERFITATRRQQLPRATAGSPRVPAARVDLIHRRRSRGCPIPHRP